MSGRSDAIAGVWWLMALSGCLRSPSALPPIPRTARVPAVAECKGQVAAPTDCAMASHTDLNQNRFVYDDVRTTFTPPWSAEAPKSAPRCSLVDDAGRWLWEVVGLHGAWAGVISCAHPHCRSVAFTLGPAEVDSPTVQTYFVLRTNYEVIEEWTTPNGLPAGSLRSLPDTPCPE